MIFDENTLKKFEPKKSIFKNIVIEKQIVKKTILKKQILTKPILKKTILQIPISKQLIFKKPILKKPVLKKTTLIHKTILKKHISNKNIVNKNIIIKQISVSDSIKSFEKKIMDKFNLLPYTNKNLPTIFFGCYNDNDFIKIKNHNSLRIILWGGSDSDIRNKKRYILLTKIKLLKNIYHLAISDYIYNDLIFIGIQKSLIKRIILNLQDFNKFNVINKGMYIYVYTGYNSVYNNIMLDNIYKSLPNENFLIYIHPNNYKNKNKNKNNNTLLNKFSFSKIIKTTTNINEVYKQCYIGLRLTDHDGNANTVQELGLHGIKCVYNGDKNMPNAISWKTKTDIINAIKNEKHTIGKSDIILKNDVEKYLNTDNKWLNTNYYI